MRRAVFTAGLFVLFTGTCAAAEDIHGRFEVTGSGSFTPLNSLDYDLGGDSTSLADVNIRLTWDPRWTNWDLSLHYVLDAQYGGTVSLNRDKAAILPAAPPATLFDLSSTISSDGDTLVTQTIDRLAIGYSGDRFVARVGRQALTWGEGRVFHPMDLIDPFAPAATETDYKPGVDMVYLQFLFDDGSDLQFVGVPRRPSGGAAITWDASTLAVQYRRSFGQLGGTLIAARDHGDWTLGLGLSGPLGGAQWNVEVVPTWVAGGDVKTSALINVSGATSLFSRNATWFVEGFHNGFGVAGAPAAFDALPVDLTDRLLRGQVFNVAQDYIAGGLSWDLTPLVTLSGSVIANLGDGSLFTTAGADISLGDNVGLSIGAQVPVGDAGTEFGGIPLTTGSSTTYAPPTYVYARLSAHF